MDKILSDIRNQINQIEGLKQFENWGVEFQIWEKRTEALIKEAFTGDDLKLFKDQDTMTTSYIDPHFNIRQYHKELEKKKKVLEALLVNVEESAKTENKNFGNSASVLKEIWRYEDAIKENIVVLSEIEKLHGELMSYLDKVLLPGSMPYLRYNKIKAEQKITWWKNEAGYPVKSPWDKFQVYLDILQQHEAEKTVKHRLEVDGLFVESRSQGEDLHLLVGKQDGGGNKAHVIIGSSSGEIRIEKGQLEPTDLVDRIEAIFTLPSGKKIKTTREAIEEII